ncbi:MAG: hypothetical protein HYU85_02520, partial [Chloroflexi bacterium]|nr:hypothetical protein [Chloroflexota bacterium]
TKAKATVLTKPEPELVPPDFASFFDEFDFDGNEEIDIEEAASFYYWVENNIQYRYDDENEANPQPGTFMGDGRPGADYRQRPYETYIERAGDCEDMATLEVAFLNYWGIAAYVAGVNADDLTYLDHAVAIALIGDNPDDFTELLGELVSWEFREGEEIQAYEIEEFPAGFYMLIDNAYSDDFGYLSGGLREGQFTIYAIVPLEVPYDDEWGAFLASVAYEWTN